MYLSVLIVLLCSVRFHKRITKAAVESPLLQPRPIQTPNTSTTQRHCINNNHKPWNDRLHLPEIRLLSQSLLHKLHELLKSPAESYVHCPSLLSTPSLPRSLLPSLLSYIHLLIPCRKKIDSKPKLCANVPSQHRQLPKQAQHPALPPASSQRIPVANARMPPSRRRMFPLQAAMRASFHQRMMASSLRATLKNTLITTSAR